MLNLATTNDINEIMAIIKDAKQRMKNDNLEQWTTDNYPNLKTIQADIEMNTLYKYTINNDIAGIIVINDDFYAQYPLKFNPAKCRAIHRVAVANKYLNHGIGVKLYTCAEQVIKNNGYQTSVVDTYSKNIKMCNLITKCNYEQVGSFTLVDSLPNWILFKKDLY